MSNNVGLTIREGVANGTTPITEAPTRNIGIAGFRERGIANTPILVTSLTEDRLRFGGLTSDYTPYVTRNLFKNAAPFGVSLYIARMMKGAYSAALAQLVKTQTGSTLSFAVTTPAGPSAAEVLTLTIGSTVAGQILAIQLPDPATSWGILYAQITSTGTAATDATNLRAEYLALATYYNASAWTPVVSGSTIVFTRSTNNVSTTANDRYASISGATLSSTEVILTVKAGQLGQEDPGTWANNNVAVELLPKGHARGSATRFTYNVFYKGKFVEKFTGVTWAELVGAVNGSSYYTTATLVTDVSTFLAQYVHLQSGANGTAMVEADIYPVDDPVTPTGLAVFKSTSVQFLACPEFNTTTMAAQGKDYASSRGNVSYIFTTTLNPSDANVQAYATLLQTAQPSFAMGYALWVKTSNEQGAYVWVPGHGIILGAGYIRVPGLSGNEAHIPPAGIDSVFRDCIDIAPNLSEDQTRINLYVQQYTINVARFSPGYGFYLASSRTMSTNPLYHSAHVRVLTNKYLDTLNNNYVWVSQKPLSPELRGQTVSSLLNYFRGEYAKGALENSIPFEEACEVISDASNNPRTQDRKLMNVDIKYIPTECSEAVVISLNRNDGQLMIRETV